MWAFGLLYASLNDTIDKRSNCLSVFLFIFCDWRKANISMDSLQNVNALKDLLDQYGDQGIGGVGGTLPTRKLYY